MALIGVKTTKKLCLLTVTILNCACATSTSQPKVANQPALLKMLKMPSEQFWGGVPSSVPVLSIFLPEGVERAIGEADFLGPLQASAADALGSCVILEAKLLPEVKKIAPIVWEFEAKLVNTRSAVRRTFIIFREESQTPLAYGVFDTEGKAVCELPLGKYAVSAGLGEARVETPFEVTDKAVQPRKTQVRMRETGRIVLVPSDEQHIFPGDMVRIGRMPLEDSAFLFSDTKISRTVQGDLFRPTRSAGENLGAVEYLFTTIFVGQNPISIDLEEGIYKFAIYSPLLKRQCLVESDVRASAVQYLRCSTAEGNDSIGQEQRTRTDATQLSESNLALLRNSGLLEQYQTNFIGISLAEKNQFISGNLTYPRILDADGISDVKNICAATVSSFEDMRRPVAGTGERSLLNGATPFWVQTVSELKPDSDFRFFDGFYYVTNGAQVEFWGTPETVLWPALPQQRVRAVMRIPMGNPTNQLSLFVNGKEFRRVPIARDISWPEARIAIDETVNLREDFTMSICAWGNNYLPEFIFGTKLALPVMVTRPVCVDMDGDGRCGYQKQGD